jgi:hypothetical protein
MFWLWNKDKKEQNKKYDKSVIMDCDNERLRDLTEILSQKEVIVTSWINPEIKELLDLLLWNLANTLAVFVEDDTIRQAIDLNTIRKKIQ